MIGRFSILAAAVAVIIWQGGCLTFENGVLVNRCGLYQRFTGLPMLIRFGYGPLHEQLSDKVVLPSGTAIYQDFTGHQYHESRDEQWNDGRVAKGATTITGITTFNASTSTNAYVTLNGGCSSGTVMTMSSSTSGSTSYPVVACSSISTGTSSWSGGGGGGIVTYEGGYGH